MKKRILSLALSLSLVMSLAVTAFAAGPEDNYYTVNVADLLDENMTPELLEQIISQSQVAVLAEKAGPMDWYTFMEQYLADHPELRENFDADAWFAENHSWWTKEEYMETMGLNEAEFQVRMWGEYCGSSEGLYPVLNRAYEAYQVDYYDAAHPGELAQLDTRAMLEKAGYYDLTAEEWYMSNNDLAAVEEVRTHLLSAYVTARLSVEETHIWFLSYQGTYPERWAEFDANAYFEEEYGGFMTKQDYMEGYTLFTQEELAEDMFVEYVRRNQWNWDTGYDWPRYDQPITLVVNGETVDAEIIAGDGITYLGADTLNAILGTSLTGDEVAIRTAAREAGWDVTWNERNREVVLLDRESLMKGFLVPAEDLEDLYSDTPEAQFIKKLMGEPNENGLFTQDFSNFDEMLNRLLAAGQGQAGQTYRTTNNLSFNLTAFNSLDGDETYTVTVKADLLVQDRLANLTLTADLAQLWKMLPQTVKNQVAAELPKVTFQNLSTLLTGCKAQFILNMEENILYWNIPLLALFDDTISENTWGKVDLSNRLGTVVAREVPLPTWNTAEKLYNDLLADSATSWWGAEDAYYDFAQARMMMGLLVGSDRVTRRGDTLTWSLDAKAIAGYMALDSYYYDYEDMNVTQLFKELDVSLSVEKNGRFTMNAAVRPDMDAIAAKYTDSYWYDAGEVALMTWIMNLLDCRYAAKASGTADRAAGTMEFHWKNQLKLTVDSNTTCQKVNTPPLSAPPAGAEVVELY